MQKDEPDRAETRMKELPDSIGEEFKQMLEEGTVRLQHSRAALKSNPHRPTPWEDITPAPLKSAIEHIRKEFATRKWQLEISVIFALNEIQFAQKYRIRVSAVLRECAEPQVWILGHQAKDQVAYFFSDSFSSEATPMTGKPFPIEAEARLDASG
jgi:hypothetical protein